MTSVLDMIRYELGQTDHKLVFNPPTCDIMQAIVVADKPYNLMDPGDYSDLCLIIQYAVSLKYSTVDIENTLSDWEAGDGPHFDEAKGKPLFTEHVLAILGLS